MSEQHLPSSLRVGVEAPDRNLALELVRVTEAAAMAGGRWVGRGDKNGADAAAVEAMRMLISTLSMEGVVVVIGEGEKDDAPMLYNGEEVGDGNGPSATSPSTRIDGTTLTAEGQSNAVAVLAVADRGSMYDPIRSVLHGQARHRTRGCGRRGHSACRSRRTSAGSPRPSGRRSRT